MKVYKTEIVPAKPEMTRQVCTNRECDICGKEAQHGDDWNNDWSSIDETEVCVTIKSEVGHSYPDGGNKTVFELDLCPKCFKDRLVPWVNSFREGKPPIVSEDIDW